MTSIRRPPALTDCAIRTLKRTRWFEQDMKDRETKRWLLDEFVKENEIRAVELEMAYKRFKNISSGASKTAKTSSSAEIDFNTWILVGLPRFCLAP